MPLYEYECGSCKLKFTRYRSMHDSALPATCNCKGEGRRILSPSAVRVDYAGYSCPVTGKWIEGRKAHEANLRAQGCHVLEAGEREEAERNRKRADSALEDAMANTAAELVAAMPPEKQAQLGHELTQSTVAYDRG